MLAAVGKITPGLKLIRDMLETWNLVRKYTLICSFKKYNFWYQDPLNFLWCQHLMQKNQGFFPQNSIFTQSNSVIAVLEIF